VHRTFCHRAQHAARSTQQSRGGEDVMSQPVGLSGPGVRADPPWAVFGRCPSARRRRRLSQVDRFVQQARPTAVYGSLTLDTIHGCHAWLPPSGRKKPVAGHVEPHRLGSGCNAEGAEGDQMDGRRRAALPAWRTGCRSSTGLSCRWIRGRSHGSNMMAAMGIHLRYPFWCMEFLRIIRIPSPPRS
jgi:hypothetical protein